MNVISGKNLFIGDENATNLTTTANTETRFTVGLASTASQTAAPH